MKKLIKKISILAIALIAIFAITACEEEQHVHEPKKIEAKAASCTEPGILEHWKCKGCNELFEDEECTEKTTEAKLETEPTGHKPSDDDGDCTTAVKCSVCEAVTTEAKPSHAPSSDDGDCTTAVKCSVCEVITTAAKPSHVPSSDDGDCTTAVKCSVCEFITTAAKASHAPSSDDGDCTTAVKCSVCEVITTAAKPSHVPSSDDGDCTTAVKCSVCEVITTEAKKHEDKNLDGNCDNCVHKLDYIHDVETNTYVVFTAEGLYTWGNDSWKGINLLLARDIVMPTELKFDIDDDGTNDSNWPGARLSATFDGNGHSISGIIMKSAVESGVCGFVTTLNTSAVLKNLRILDADMSFIGINYGILVGYNDGLIENCGVSGKIYVDGNNVAGIAGTNSGTIIACYSDAEVFATSGHSGGIAGQNSTDNYVIACYNTGAIPLETSSTNAGIIGAFYGGKIVASYSTSEVAGSYHFGAIAGYRDSSAELISNYWSTSAATPEYGIGSGDNNNENAENVDGVTLTWANAMIEMNAALEAYGTEYRYSLNTGLDSDIRPLVLSIPQN